jgi:hypothetical protein
MWLTDGVESHGVVKKKRTRCVAKEFLRTPWRKHRYPMVLTTGGRRPVNTLAFVHRAGKSKFGPAYIDTNSDKTMKTETVPSQTRR